MKRFHFNNDDDEEEENEENEGKFMGPDFLSMTPFSIGSENGTLNLAVKVCEKMLFWKFYSLQTKLNKIKEVYLFLVDLEEENFKGDI